MFKSALFLLSRGLNRNNIFRRTMTMAKIDSQQFRELLSPELNLLSDVFSKNGHELRIAGGAVRDLLMGIPPADVDFATTATPEQMKNIFTAENIRMINALGEKHGTITARINDKINFEVTTLRIDKVTDGRRAEVEFTKDWELDANRRDLTINSMFLGLDGTVYDYFDGQTDLKNRRVRFVGDPVQRIQEDYLRILRYFRFYGRISESPENHEEVTLNAIRENIKGMGIISGERIWSEWKKILSGRYAGQLTAKMIELGLAPYIGLPVNPDKEEMMMVWEKAEKNNIKLNSPTLLASLLRDSEEVLALHGRIKLSGVERDNCLFVVEHRGTKPAPTAIRPYQYLMVDSKSKPADTRMYINQVLLYNGDLALAEEFESWEAPRFPVTGNHLKENGCPPGRIMSVVLTKLKDIWKESNFEMPLDNLILQIPSILETVSVEDIQKEKRPKSRQRR